MGKPEYSRWMGVEYAELVRLLDEIDRHGRKSPVSDKRVNSRFEYRSGPILFSAQHPGGTKVTTCVIGRNLSCGGMAVIYRGFLHKDTVCTIELTKLDGVKVSVQGRVRVCRHLEHMLHEIGIQFTEIVLDPKEFCAPDTRQTSSSAPGGGGGPRGPLPVWADALCVSNHAARLHQLAQALTAAGFNAVAAPSLGAGADAIKRSRFDLVVIDGEPEGEDPARIVEIIRAADHRGPLMGLGW